MKTIQLQVAITLDESTIRSLADLLVPIVKQAMPTSEVESDRKRETRSQVSRNALFDGKRPPEDQGLLIATKEAAKLLKVSERTLWQMQTTGRMPPPIRIGRAVRWSLDVLKKWVEAGCPVDPKWRSEGM